MKQTFNLAKSTLTFYAFIAPFIIGGSFYNLIYGLILGESSTVRIGAFSLLGFVIFPILLISTYLRNRIVITDQNVRIHKTDFPRSQYDFAVTDRFLPFKERPLFSLLRKDTIPWKLLKNQTAPSFFTMIWKRPKPMLRKLNWLCSTNN